MSTDQYRALHHAEKPKKPKFRNKITMVDGIRFDSKKEADRWDDLRILYRAGEITKLSRQPKYPFHLHGKLMFAYVADFRYTVVKTGVEVIEDVKSKPTITRMYRLKKKIIEEMYGISITEVM